MTYLAKNIRKCRENGNMTQFELAEKLGVNQGTISRFEKGTKVPTVARLERLADIFDTSMDSLAGRT